MEKYLIKNTTKEERIELVKAWEEEEGCESCGMNLLNFYRDYIDGKKEISEVNASYRTGFVSEIPEDNKVSCGMGRR